MTGKQRMRQALSGGQPDRVPVGFFYNCDYKAQLAGLTPQHYIFGTNEDRYQAMAATYRRHAEDWIHADPGINYQWSAEHRLIWEDGQAFVEQVASGQRDAIRPDLTLASANERSHGPGLDFGYSYARFNRPLECIKTPQDLQDAQIRTAAQLIQEGFLDPPQRLVQEFGSQAFITLPMGNIFFNSVYLFGLEEGLIATVTDPDLFHALLEINLAQELEVIKAAAKVGLDGVWLAEMLISADIVPPHLYAHLVAPLHRQLVEEAHRHDLKALAYLTGDCLPLLGTARQVGYDGIVIESADKHGQKIDVAAVRREVGTEMCVFGNLDPVDHLLAADEPTLRQEILRQIWAAGREGAFVAHSNIVSLPIQPDRIDLVIRIVQEVGQYPLSVEGQQ